MAETTGPKIDENINYKKDEKSGSEMATDIFTGAWNGVNKKYGLVNSYNFVLRVEGVYDLPIKSIRGINKQNEYEYIQEGGLNDYVHMIRKPISQPFTFQIERYVGLEFIDPLANGTELLLPLVLYIYHSVRLDSAPVRYYIFTNARVTGVQIGDLDAEKSGLHTVTTTIAYSQLTTFTLPYEDITMNDPYDIVNDYTNNKYATTPKEFIGLQDGERRVRTVDEMEDQAIDYRYFMHDGTVKKSDGSEVPVTKNKRSKNLTSIYDSGTYILSKDGVSKESRAKYEFKETSIVPNDDGTPIYVGDTTRSPLLAAQKLEDKYTLSKDGLEEENRAKYQFKAEGPADKDGKKPTIQNTAHSPLLAAQSLNTKYKLSEAGLDEATRAKYQFKAEGPADKDGKKPTIQNTAHSPLLAAQKLDDNYTLKVDGVSAEERAKYQFKAEGPADKDGKKPTIQNKDHSPLLAAQKLDDNYTLKVDGVSAEERAKYQFKAEGPADKDGKKPTIQNKDHSPLLAAQELDKNYTLKVEESVPGEDRKYKFNDNNGANVSHSKIYESNSYNSNYTLEVEGLPESQRAKYTYKVDGDAVDENGTPIKIGNTQHSTLLDEQKLDTNYVLKVDGKGLGDASKYKYNKNNGENLEHSGIFESNGNTTKYPTQKDAEENSIAKYDFKTVKIVAKEGQPLQGEMESKARKYPKVRSAKSVADFLKNKK